MSPHFISEKHFFVIMYLRFSNDMASLVIIMHLILIFQCLALSRFFYMREIFFVGHLLIPLLGQPYQHNIEYLFCVLMLYSSPLFLTVFFNLSVIVLKRKGLRPSPWRISYIILNCCVTIWLVCICVFMFRIVSFIIFMHSLEVFMITSISITSFSFTLSKAFVRSTKPS